MADTWNVRFQVFSPNGRFEREWSKDFFGPRGIAVDAQSNVFVANTGNGRILKFTSKGEELWRVGTKGSGQGQFNEPVGIVLFPSKRSFRGGAAVLHRYYAGRGRGRGEGAPFRDRVEEGSSVRRGAPVKSV